MHGFFFIMYAYYLMTHSSIRRGTCTWMNLMGGKGANIKKVENRLNFNPIFLFIFYFMFFYLRGGGNLYPFENDFFEPDTYVSKVNKGSNISQMLTTSQP